jgi:hypothetical protein
MKSLVVAVAAETVAAEAVAAEAVAAEAVVAEVVAAEAVVAEAVAAEVVVAEAVAAEVVVAEAVAVVLPLFAQPISLRHSHKMDTFPFYLHKQQVVLSCESIEDR